MVSAWRKRFADVYLGEVVEVPGAGVGGSWEEAARALVRAWSGSDSVAVLHVAAPSPAARPRDLSGRIYARHLDRTGHVDVEIIGRDRGQICATAMVRAALA